MARRRNNNNKAAPASDKPKAQLELPEGYTPPKAKTKSPRRRPKKADKVTPMEPNAILPWIVNSKYVSGRKH